MGPPSSFFLAIVAIVVLFFAILSFISAVNYKNVANNDTEGESIGKGTANSLSTAMIIFGIIMILVFIWFGYLVFTYDKTKLIDQRDVSLLVKAKESIDKFGSVKTAYQKLQESFKNYRDKATEKDKEKSKWDYCPEPLIKLNIKGDTGKIKEIKYDITGDPKSLIIKPEKNSDGTYKKLEFEMETQACYKIEQNCGTGGYGSGLLGQKWNGQTMNQSMNQPMMSAYSSSFIPGTRQNMINPSFQLSDPNIPQKCGNDGFLTSKTVPLPGLNFGKCEKPNQPMMNPYAVPNIGRPNQNPAGDMSGFGIPSM
jgi:hypothetical protein